MSLLRRLLKQTAVYWPPSTAGHDAFGNPIRSNPVEVACRWEEKAEEFIGPDGEKETSRAVVFLDTDVAVRGLLYLGTLDSLYVTDDSFLFLADTNDDAYGIQSGEFWFPSLTHLDWSGLLPPSETWLSFPSTLAPDAVVVSATLTLSNLSPAYASSLATVEVLAWWSNLVSYPAPSPDVILSQDVVVPQGYGGEPLEFDVTDLVQAVLNHFGYTNPGRICFRIRGASGAVLRQASSYDNPSGQAPQLLVSIKDIAVSDPRVIGACEIRSAPRTPTINGKEIVRSVYL